ARSASATGSRTACSSRATTCTCRGPFRPRWSTRSPLRIRRSATAAPGSGSPSTARRASFSRRSSSRSSSDARARPRGDRGRRPPGGRGCAGGALRPPLGRGRPPSRLWHREPDRTLGGAYLELVAVVDEDDAAGSGSGRWVAASHPDPLQLPGWAVRTDGLDALAQRLDLHVSLGSRMGPGGSVAPWRLADCIDGTGWPPIPSPARQSLRLGSVPYARVNTPQSVVARRFLEAGAGASPDPGNERRVRAGSPDSRSAAAWLAATAVRNAPVV